MNATVISPRTICPRCGAPSLVVEWPNGRRSLLSIMSTVPGVASAFGAHRCGE
jgi:RNA polymerase subunit RPABC4/transcription elongation factor Spt4